MNNQYFQWLCDIVCVNTAENSYWLLTKALHRKEFFWTVANDDNRAADGKKLRERFSDEMGYSSCDPISGPCTVFELLIALAERCERMMAGSCDKKTADWFWKILENIGLDKYTDDSYADTAAPSVAAGISARATFRERFMFKAPGDFAPRLAFHH
jgi:hypothetical protein